MPLGRRFNLNVQIHIQHETEESNLTNNQHQQLEEFNALRTMNL